ncbi:ABC transporter ATP-binding protein [Oceanobacillus profundus]|uniref:ABC transporter ATP-binding protein n=1 Tax=Oceanobacillus profundus TaxID=372463 RepID=A0A417YBL9_9BACI|nr:ABC transporter ATP-binding protein [Oceanobacillus profundus]MBR3118126.1 ABC transporter ATP-binding protein [Oceanobacillus sp.]PAE27795.1 ABC transporter ATP-binding protein [Paenibacillus sp. 7884-2]MCM3400020.1 ABC transporter ATP-binding protein [Oceanobacillus profundus]MDO6450859.1 ABC transporter ATP-binding protein [Oceanobacillus profundus]RHW29971.1 ABC transporter ATP-binding protein [Oceanobacillus profundus]
MIKVNNLTKSFIQGQARTQVLKGVDLHVEEGEFVAIMGPSGSGKSTLLQLLGGLDIPTEGDILINQNNLSEMTEKERTIFRRKYIGFIFQNYQLLPTLNVEENIAFPLHADGSLTKEKYQFILELLDSVGLKELGRKRANLLSGGQQQRVAIARALVNNPSVLLADEPTGNLDRNKAEEILGLIARFNRESNQTIIMVTHDIFAAGFADRIILFKDGVIDQVISRKDDDYAKYVANFMA